MPTKTIELLLKYAPHLVRIICAGRDITKAIFDYRKTRERERTKRHQVSVKAKVREAELNAKGKKPPAQ